MDILASDCSRREKIMLGNRELRNGAKIFFLRLHTTGSRNSQHIEHEPRGTLDRTELRAIRCIRDFILKESTEKCKDQRTVATSL